MLCKNNFKLTLSSNRWLFLCISVELLIHTLLHESGPCSVYSLSASFGMKGVFVPHSMSGWQIGSQNTVRRTCSSNVPTSTITTTTTKKGNCDAESSFSKLTGITSIVEAWTLHFLSSETYNALFCLHETCILQLSNCCLKSALSIFYIQKIIKNHV